jgi:hypothetical protein
MASATSTASAAGTTTRMLRPPTRRPSLPQKPALRKQGDRAKKRGCVSWAMR